MRNFQINNVVVEYPDSLVFVQDNLYIKLRNVYSQPIGLVECTVLGDTTTKKTIYIDNHIATLPFINNVTGIINFIISINGDSKNFICNVLNGKTLPIKKHGSDNYIYTNEDTVDVFLPFTAKINDTVYPAGVNNVSFGEDITLTYLTPIGSLDVEVDNDTPGVYTYNLCFKDVFNTTEIEGGDIFNCGVNFPKIIKVEKRELCCGEVVVKYTNTDGCKRMLFGKTLGVEYNSNGEYYSVINVIKNIPKFNKTDNTITLTVGFQDINRYAYPEDIVYSDVIYIVYNDVEYECTLDEYKFISKREDIVDFEIVLKILV